MTFKFKSRKFVYTHSYSLINVHAALLAAKDSVVRMRFVCQQQILLLWKNIVIKEGL